ncbi:MAG: cation transporter [Owenweeksia sp.]|nr:cation transporter [Owenweeksia sp.]
MNEPTARKTFGVSGMSCASCAVSVASVLQQTNGVVDAGVNSANATAWARYNPEEVSAKEMQRGVRAIGYNLILEEEEDSRNIRKSMFIIIKR